MKKNKLFYTRVQSGKFKAKLLAIPVSAGTRATKARVRACVFNTIRDILSEHIFIELFAGSAIMSVEALSNQAFKAIAIEKDKEIFKVALKNAKISTKLKLYNDDSFKLLKSLIEKAQKPIILYIDPPFDYREGFLNIYEDILKLIGEQALEKISLIIFEKNSFKALPKEFSGFIFFKEKLFKNTSLSFYKKKS